MAIDFNTAPYYDDFNKSKNFYRILFKPGRAVQARELTQLQTILQNQIESFGTNIFKDGSLIHGGKTFFSSGIYLKLASTSVSIDNFENETIVGAVSGATAKVIKYTNASGSLPDILYITNVFGNFRDGETISIQGSVITAVISAVTASFTGPTTFFSIEESIFFTKGNFVYCDPQTIIISPTLEVVPTARIGLKAVESIVNSDDDASLLDPAVGTNNYFAPGADRYAIELILTSIEYDPEVENSDAITVDNFIEICNIRYGEIIKLVTDSDFNKLEDALAKRTFEESGDYTVKPFLGTIKPHLYGNTSQFSFELTPGKAYVKGYGFETTSSTSLTIDKARDTLTVSNFPITADYGRYVVVKDVKGFINPAISQVFTLHSNYIGNVNITDANTFSNTTIGSARVRYLENTGTAAGYKLYLYDIAMNAGQNFSNVLAFASANTLAAPVTIAASANTSSAPATITYGTDDSTVFVVPQNNIKTFAPGGSPDTSYTSVKLFESVSFTQGTGADSGNSIATISLTGTETFLGSGFLSDDAINSRFFAAVTSSTGIPEVGNVINFFGAFGSIEITGGGTTAVLKTNGTTAFSANILAVHSTASATSKLKTKVDSNIIINFGSNVYQMSLGVADALYVSSIVDAQGNIYTGSYILDNGQRDDFYDHARVLLKPGAVYPVLNNITNPNVTISFTYFSHAGSGFFSADSYTNSGISYEDIPTYTTTRGTKYNLADVVDFRPVRQPSSNIIISTKLIQPASTITADYEYYIGRVDKVIVSKDKRFGVIKGRPGVSPEVPKDSPDSMTIYTINIPPYTKSLNDIKVGFVDNRRYTMRDISKIDKRVSRLEYYTTLSLLEKVAADERVPSSVPGVDRFKNGILVDPFAGHGIGDVTNVDYACSIDSDNRLLRPLFTSDVQQFYVDEAISTNYEKTGDIVTPPYTESTYISQTKASKTTYLVPYEVFSWVGEMVLEPATDIWHDTYTNPSVVVNVNGENDVFTQITLSNNGLNPWSTKWNAWQSVFRGITDVDVGTSVSTTTDTKVAVDGAGNISTRSTSRSETTTTTDISTSESFTRSGIAFSSASKTITTNLGSRLIDSSLIPYIRSRPITFVAKNLKPNTQIFASFDNVDVTDYCYPAIELTLSANITSTLVATTVTTASSAANVILQKSNKLYVVPDITKPLFGSSDTVTIGIKNGSPITRTLTDVVVPSSLRTNQNGDVSGVFVIPNNNELRFNIGERPFVLADSLNKLYVTTAAQTTYLAHGISTISQDTILATRMNLVSIDPLQSIRQENLGITRSTTSSAISTVGSASTAALPPTNQITNNIVNIVNNNTNIITNVVQNNNISVVNIVNYGVQDLFCGQTTNSAGINGVYTYRINLGSGTVGLANVVCVAGNVPVRFSLAYNGVEQSTQFFTNLGYNYITDPNGYSDALQRLGYPRISGSYASQTLSIRKLTANVEFATLTVTAPLAGDRWRFNVNCPTGSVNPAPGTAKVTLTKSATGGSSVSFWADNDTFWTSADRANNRPIDTATRKVGLQYTIVNTASDVSRVLDGDGSIRVNSINVDTSGISEARAGAATTYAVETTGTSYDVFSGSVHVGPGSRSVNRGVTGKADTATALVNNLGALPAIIPPGQARTFTVTLDHPAVSVVRGSLKVDIDVTNTTGSNVAAHNDPVINVNTIPSATSRIIDPVAQTFFVDETKNPSGVFLTSVDLWFAAKSSSVPVTLEIRPVVNGYPSSAEIVSFGSITVDSDSIVTSSTENVFDVDEYTKFTFRSPVYCPPGQYAIVIKGNSSDYRIYTAALGDFEIGSTTARITQQPYIGSMFKSQNASTWSPEQLEDVTFRINSAVFDTEAVSSVYLKSLAGPYDIDYDVFYAFGETLSFVNTKSNYYYKTRNKATGTLDSTFVPYQLGKNIPMAARRNVIANDGSTLQLSFDLSTEDSTIAPVVDLNRLSSVLVKNEINNDATGEDSYSGGNAKARYITRKVTLAEGFESTDLKVYLNAFCPGASSFKVYCKVNAPGTTQFDSQNKYQELTLTGETGNKREGFAEFVYESGTNSILPDGAKFNTFVLKIVMLSPDPVYVPIIRDLRVLALDEY